MPATARRRYGLSVAAVPPALGAGRAVQRALVQWTDNEKKLDPDMGIYVKDTDVAECFALALEQPTPGL